MGLVVRLGPAKRKIHEKNKFYGRCRNRSLSLREKLENVQRRMRFASRSFNSCLNDGHPGEHAHKSVHTRNTERTIHSIYCCHIFGRCHRHLLHSAVNFTLSNNSIGAHNSHFIASCLLQHNLLHSLFLFYFFSFFRSSYSFLFVPFILFYEH